MKQVNLRIVVLPCTVQRSDIIGADESFVGKNFSTTEKLIFNKVDEETYSLLYTDDVFGRIEMASLHQTLKHTLKMKLPDTLVLISSFYLCKTAFGNEGFHFSDRTGMKLITLANLFMEEDDQYLVYLLSDSIRWTRSILLEHANDQVPIPEFRNQDYEESEYDDSDYEDDGEEDEEEDEELVDFYRNIGKSPLTYGSKKKKSKKKGHYSQSKVVAHAKHPKKEFDRHGVVIWRDRDDRDRDEKMIKSFLKDFIPGNARWKREFRNDLLDRWMEAFTIKKKKLQRLEKKMQKSKKRKKRKVSPGAAMAMNLSNQIMRATTTDPWNNPNK